jgi:hypothetical protein
MSAHMIFNGLVLLLFTSVVQSSVLVAVDDGMGVPFGAPLQVEAFGVLENDTLDGEAAGENGALAELVSDVTYGTLSCPTNLKLALCPDGSFDYFPDLDLDFTGTDSFTYQAVFGSLVSAPATVTLTACTGGPDVLSCWQEAPYLAKLTALGYRAFREGFEGTAWDSVRSVFDSPTSAPSITSMGITWTSNHPGTNDITTGPGPARTGLWGGYDPGHGYATGSKTECDVDTPPIHCLYYDGLSGRMATGGNALLGVGGYITGFYGSNIAILLDGASYNVGWLPDAGHQFFGVIDATGGGFTSFEFRELDGKIGQKKLIFTDDFIIATSDTLPVNNPPVLEPVNDQAVDEGSLLSILLSASDPDDGDSWSFSMIDAPATALLEDNYDGTATFSWRPDFDQAGDYPVSFIVTDNGLPSASDSETITITVVDVNQPPMLTPIGNQAVNENEPLSIPLTASDPDGDNVSFSVSGAPTGSIWVDNLDGTANFSWTPEAGSEGIYPVSFAVTDDGAPAATDSEEISILVGKDCTDVYSVISIDTVCIGNSSITVHPGVIVQADVTLALSAPAIHFMNDVIIESGATLQVISAP